jgi:CelD/BcsL family acetyltransferase involved in cellulose biosynthesis
VADGLAGEAEGVVPRALARGVAAGREAGGTGQAADPGVRLAVRVRTDRDRIVDHLLEHGAAGGPLGQHLVVGELDEPAMGVGVGADRDAVEVESPQLVGREHRCVRRVGMIAADPVGDHEDGRRHPEVGEEGGQSVEVVAEPIVERERGVALGHAVGRPLGELAEVDQPVAVGPEPAHVAFDGGGTDEQSVGVLPVGQDGDPVEGQRERRGTGWHDGYGTRVRRADGQAATGERDASADLTVEVVGSLRAIDDEVGRLGSLAGHPFATRGWLHAAWDASCSAGDSPQALVVRDRTGCVVGVWVIEHAGAGWRNLGGSLVDIGDPIAASADVPTVASALAAHLSQEGGGFAGSALGTEVARALVAVGGGTIGAPLSGPIVRIDGSAWEQYLTGRASRRRRRIAAQADRLLGSDEVAVIEVVDPVAMSGALDELVRLHGLRFGRDSSVFTPIRRRFFEQAILGMAAEGLVRLRLLLWDGHAVAAILVFRCGDDDWYYQSGFDPGFAQHSVGRALFADTLRDAFEARRRAFCLLRGTEAYKLYWANDDRPVHAVRLGPSGCEGTP